jgi:outer membrane protein assembly factor BamA
MKINISCALTIVFICSQQSLFAQVRADSSVQKLPFSISKAKKLSAEDLKDKKEGTYVTGVPDISSDPVNGFGYGAEGSIIFDGKKRDPFFAYTPYRKKLDVALFNTSRQQREVSLKLDVPYIFNTKWRLRASASYEVNPNLLYFGITERSLNSLKKLSAMDSIPVPPFTGNKYKDYDASLTGNNFNYNRYTKQEIVANISMERSFIDGKLRLLAGYEIGRVNSKPFDGNSRLFNDFQKGGITGVGTYWISMVQLGIIYDTRDLETDPSKGVFAELTNEFSNHVFGSGLNFNKTFAHFKFYQKVLPGVFKKVILAARAGIGYTGGNAPFFEYQDGWSSEGSIAGLGGAYTLRGYKESRFLARVMDFVNVELRCRFFQTNILKQHLAFSTVPFFDIGGVWDKLSNMNNFNNYRYSEGLGLRIAWNVNTILRFDYAFSNEDNQFFFNFGHTF